MTKVRDSELRAIVKICGEVAEIRHPLERADHFLRAGQTLIDADVLGIHLPNSKVSGELPGAVGQIDVAPSLLHLLGIDNADQAFLGRNMLAGPHAGVSVYGYASDGSVALRSGPEPGARSCIGCPAGREWP